MNQLIRLPLWVFYFSGQRGKTPKLCGHFFTWVLQTQKQDILFYFFIEAECLLKKAKLEVLNENKVLIALVNEKSLFFIFLKNLLFQIP